MHVEAWDRFPMRGCANRSGETHFRLARHYRVPVVSFMLGACAMHADGDARHWRGGCSPNASTCQSQDEPGLQCEPHPGPHTHAVYALLVAEAISREAAALCRGRRGAVDDVPSSGPVLLPAPPRPLPLAADAPTLLPKEMRATKQTEYGCRAKHGVSNPTLTLDFVEGGCGAPREQRRLALSAVARTARASAAGSPRATPARRAACSRLASDAAARASDGRLTVTFLRSYDRRVGRARLAAATPTSAPPSRWQRLVGAAHVAGATSPSCRSARPLRGARVPAAPRDARRPHGAADRGAAARVQAAARPPSCAGAASMSSASSSSAGGTPQRRKASALLLLRSRELHVDVFGDERFGVSFFLAATTACLRRQSCRACCRWKDARRGAAQRARGSAVVRHLRETARARVEWPFRVLAPPRWRARPPS